MNPSDLPYFIGVGRSTARAETVPTVGQSIVRSLGSRLATLKLRGRKGCKAEYHLRAARQPGFYKTVASSAWYNLQNQCKLLIFIEKFTENY
jgi:hypothetical protein